MKDDDHMTTMIMMRMMRIGVMMMIFMSLTKTTTKSEVYHRKKVNDEPQKEKRWTLLKKDRLLRRWFALLWIHLYSYTNSSPTWQKVEWKWSHVFDKLTELEYLKSFCYFLDIFLQRAWNTWTCTDNLLVERPWRSRQTQKIYYCVSFEISFCLIQ